MDTNSQFPEIPDRKGYWTSLKIWLSIVSFIISFIVVMLLPYNIPNHLIFAALLGFLSACLTLKLLFSVNSSYTLKPPKRWFIFALFYLLLIVGVILTFLIPDELVVLNLYSISVSLKLLCVVLLAVFVPGYALISSFELKKKLRYLEKSLLSVIISILLTGLMGYLSWTIGPLIDNITGIFIVLNLLILSLYTERMYVEHRKGNDSQEPEIQIDVLSSVVLFILLGIVLTSYFTIHNALSNSLPLVGDEFGHVMNITKFLNDYYAWQEITLSQLTLPAYPYLFHLFFATIVAISGFPLVEFYLASSIVFLSLPIVSFYYMASSITKRPNLSLLATVIFQVFSGLGWILSLVLYDPANEIGAIALSAYGSSDILFSTWFPIIVAPYLLDITAFFMVIGILLNKRTTTIQTTLIFSVLTSFTILAHLEKSIIFIVLGLGLSLLQVPLKTKPFRTLELGLASVISIGFVFIIDSFSRFKLYIPSFGGSLALLLILGILIITISFLNLSAVKIIKNMQSIVLKNTNKLIKFAFITFMFFAILGIVNGATPLPHSAIIPIYFLPSKLGIAGILLAYWIYKIRPEDVKGNLVLFMLLLSVLAFEALLYHLIPNVYTLFGHNLDEFRFIRDVTWPIVSIGAAAGSLMIIRRVLNGAKSKSIQRIAICAMVIGLVLSTSVFSHLLKVEYTASSNGVPQNASGVLEFLKTLEIEKGEALYTIPALQSAVSAISGAQVYTESSSIYGEILGSSIDIPSILYVIEYLNISCIIDRQTNQAPISKILEYAPILYEDNDYCVYQVSDFSYPNIDADTLYWDDELPVKIALELGVESDLEWIDNFSDISSWTPVNSIIANVTAYGLDNDDGFAKLSAINNYANQKMVVFYEKILTDPILVMDDTELWLRFRTIGGTKLVVSIIFDDGSIDNALLGSTPYLTGLDWTYSRTILSKLGASIIGFRIGITNKFDENEIEIQAEIERLAISKSDPGYVEGLLTFASTGLDFYPSFDSMIPNHKTIITAEEVNSNTKLEQVINFSEKGHDVVVLGYIQNESWISQLINITLLANTHIVNEVNIENESYSIPSMQLQEVHVDTSFVTAWYGDQEQVPLAIRAPVTNGTPIIFLNIWPLIHSLKDGINLQEHLQIQEIFRLVFSELVGISSSPTLERKFYIKNQGNILLEGIFTLRDSEHRLVFNGTRYDNLEFNGVITIRSCMFGYSIVQVSGSMIYEEDGIFISRVLSSNQTYLLKITNVDGVGIARFDTLSSGVPYSQILEREPYIAVDNISFDFIAVDCEVALITPNQLTGFGG